MTVGFDEIALGEASPSEARQVIRAALKEGGGRTAESIYRAMRAWTWKCLSDGRRDDELRSWHELIARTSAYLEPDHRTFADKLTTLKELVSESITAGERLPVSEVLQRGHVREILMEIHGAPLRRVYRIALLRQFGLGQANMSRVLNMMSTAGLIRRTSYGKHAAFTLTPTGARAAKMISDQRLTVPVVKSAMVATNVAPDPVKSEGAKQVRHSKELLHPTRSVSGYEAPVYSKAV
ncbi:hypothetical protein [Bradyrhizobium sp. LA2.1]|uniref:hypothetical protein n=1 Tax=Bradyrhizobium sp. LA2.1 TaxID=3156376 RepID=UPI003397EE73